MQPLDGNAIAGQLHEVFAAEMTMADTVCASCGTSCRLAEVEVYLRGPGTVARCRRCGAILIVLVTVRDITCVDLRGLDRLEQVPPTPTQEA